MEPEIKTYTKREDIEQEWFTTKDFVEVLRGKGFASHTLTIARWEREGIIPLPTRVRYQGQLWRVYSKDGKDFEDIISRLEGMAGRRVNRRT